MIHIYVREDCPFCEKVLQEARQLGLKEGVEYITIDALPDTPGREEVLRIGGKAMVPFLTDGDTAMYESDDIVAYLQRKFGDS